jgi:hypothetical protein
MAWNGFCAICGARTTRYTIDTIVIAGETRTVLACERCHIKLRPKRGLRETKPIEVVIPATEKLGKTETPTGFKEAKGNIPVKKADSNKDKKKAVATAVA